MKIILAKPRGFCAGVDRAIICVEKTLERHGAPVYVLNDIVHNKVVVDDLRKKGAVFVKDLTDVPEGAILLFSKWSGGGESTIMAVEGRFANRRARRGGPLGIPRPVLTSVERLVDGKGG